MFIQCAPNNRKVVMGGQDAPNKKVRVAHIEDELGIRNSFRIVLGRVGYEVIGFDGGAAYFEHVATHGHNYQAVICDRNMPAMSGLEIHRRVGAELDTQNIPFILFSSDIPPGWTGFRIEKPASPDEIRTVVAAAIAAKQAPKT